MSRVCQITKKKMLSGHNVSHSHNKTLRKWLVNLKKKRIFDSSTGRWVKLCVSTRGLRSISRKGLGKALADAGLK